MSRWHTGLGPLGVCGVAWLAFTCSKAEPEVVSQQRAASGRDVHAARDDPPTARRQTLEDLRRARDLPRHSSDGGGQAWLDPLSSTLTPRAGQRGRWTIVYEAGPEGVAVGGFVRLTVPRFWDWTPAQTFESSFPGFTTVSCDVEGVEIEPVDVPEYWVDFFVRGRGLAEGEQLRIVYGAGPAGAIADKYAEHGSRFWISVDGDGDGVGRVLADSPAVDVLPGLASLLSAILPSTAEPEETVVMRLAFLDAAGNAGAEFEGDVYLVAAPEGLVLPEKVTFTAADHGTRAIEIRASESGVYRLLARAEHEGTEFLGESNPILVEDGVARVRWCDFHGHSNLSDGTGTPEDFLTYARDVAGLDAVSLTDHDHWGVLFLDETPEMWAEIREAGERFHEPGRFVTILGYEWTNWIHGHRHVLYFGSDGPVLSSIDENYETPDQLWDGLRGLPALTFAHHSAGGPIATNWNFAPDPVLEPVTEVASVHGASEAPDAPQRIYSPLKGNFVRDALDRGYRLGFLGSGDSHDGHPGLAHLMSGYMGGLAAVLSDDLTREGIRGALSERRCYATNGPRILLRAALDGNRMGSAVPAKSERSLLYVRAVACAPIERIELVRSGKLEKTVEGGEHWDVETVFELESLTANEYLYVRVVQADGGAAWSSPIFVE